MTRAEIRTKKQIKDLLSLGDLQEALSAAIQYAAFCNSTELQQYLEQLQASLQHHVQGWTTGQLEYGEFSREHAKVTAGFLGCLERLPPHPAPGAGKRTFLTEAKFQKRIFWLLLICKGYILFWIFWHWVQFKSFDYERMMVLFGILGPAFVAGIYTISSYYIDQHKKSIHSQRFIEGPLVWIAYFSFPIYAIVMRNVLYLGTYGHEFSFATMCSIMGIMETALGSLIGKIVGTFFKQEE